MAAQLICPTCEMPTLAGICRQCAFSAALARVSPDSSDTGSLVIGPEAPDGYELLRELGCGATATVWLARERKLDRLVALKLISANADGRLTQRLIREGQAVAGLRHPNIVAVHAMSAAEHRAYLTMDFFEGGDLRQKLARGLPSPGESAALLRKLADAVAHAHLHGVLHRDIKPSNVLLDAAGEPHLGDFGLAAPLEGGGDLTAPGQVAGTAAYLAPELLAGADRASPASDIYGLGAVLYECLTGRPPFIGDSSAAIFAQITGAEPPSPRLLRPEITRDLETICLKSLEKRPARRYVSADALRDDLDRLQRGEPIAARPVGLLGKAARWCRRRPSTATFAGLATALLLCLATGGPLVALRLARANAHASAEAAASKAVSEFLQNDLLAQAAPDIQPDRDLKLRTVLDRATKSLESRFANQPLIEADIRETLANTYYSLGEFTVARQQWEHVRELRAQALGAGHEKTLHAAAGVSGALRAEGKYPEAERLATEVLDTQSRLLGPEHPETVSSMNGLALIYRQEGKLAAAETLYTKALEILHRIKGREDLETLTVMSNLGGAYRGLGKYADAERLYRENLAIRRRVLGRDHPNTLVSIGNLALVLGDQEKFAEAVQLGLEALDGEKRVLGPEHPNTLTAMGRLALIYQDSGKPGEAETLYLQLLAAQRSKLGAEHPSVLVTMNNLARLYAGEGKLSEAVALNAQTLEIRRRVLGPQHAYTLITMGQLAANYRDEGKLTEANHLATQALEISERTLGPTHALTLQIVKMLGSILLLQGRPADAEPLLQRFLNEGAKTASFAWHVASAQSQLGQALLGLRRYDQAEPMLLAGYAGLKKAAALIPPASRREITETSDHIRQLYREWNQPDKATAWEKSLSDTVANR